MACELNGNLAAPDAVAMIEGYRQGRFSPADAMADVLARMEKADPALNAICYSDPPEDDGRILAFARRAEAVPASWMPKRFFGYLK